MKLTGKSLKSGINVLLPPFLLLQVHAMLIHARIMEYVPPLKMVHLFANAQLNSKARHVKVINYTRHRSLKKNLKKPH